MHITTLQLNIERGRFLKSLISYILEKKFTILTFQEVSSGYYSYNNKNCFQFLKDNLPDYFGVLVVNFRLKNDKNSFVGNATFIRKSFSVTSHQNIFLKPYGEFDKSINASEHATSASIIEIYYKNLAVTLINTHLAWSPTSKDTDYKIKQASVLASYIAQIKTPYILSGDFNVDQSTLVIQFFNQLGNNLINTHHIKNTLNPKTHRLTHLFPKGIAVDYIFISHDIKVRSFKVIKRKLSDHFALSLACTIK